MTDNVLHISNFRSPRNPQVLSVIQPFVCLKCSQYSDSNVIPSCAKKQLEKRFSIVFHNWLLVFNTFKGIPSSIAFRMDKDWAKSYTWMRHGCWRNIPTLDENTPSLMCTRLFVQLRPIAQISLMQLTNDGHIILDHLRWSCIIWCNHPRPQLLQE